MDSRSARSIEEDEMQTRNHRIAAQQKREFERLAVSMTVMTDLVDLGLDTIAKSREIAQRLMDFVERLEAEQEARS
jgi:hypothetical protein